jgi:hypothetical protein
LSIDTLLKVKKGVGDVGRWGDGEMGWWGIGDRENK